MSRSPNSGAYHSWKSFLQCPDCGSGNIELNHYDDGTMFNCRHCGAEAWAASLVEKEL